MTKVLIGMIISFLFVFQVNATIDMGIVREMGIVTGGRTGTYIQIGKNISSLVSRSGINLKVIPSHGSLDNVADVFETPGVQLGIVQSDVLAFIRSQDDSHLKKIARKIKMVFPLYNEEIHILATHSIDNLSDLNGKIVAIGKTGSGTFLTSKVIFEISGVQPQKMVKLGGGNALNQLVNGEIDAMFYVAGYPVKLFKEFQEEKFHLVPITDKSVAEYYVPSKIPANTYPFQEDALSTVAVKAVLITYNYRALHCRTVGRLANIMYNNLSWLRQNGHAKWREVDLDYPLKKWEQYICVKNAIGLNSKNPSSRSSTREPENDSKNTLRRFLDKW